MDKRKKIIRALVFFYLVFFPFGQLIGFIFNIFYPDSPTIHLTDVLIGLTSFVTLVLYHRELLKLSWFRPFLNLSIVFFFGFIISALSFDIRFELGLLYLIRLISYLIFFASSYFVFENSKNKDLLINSIVLLGLSIAVFGFLQYLWLPDLRTLKLLEWDDHYYRLVSTFLDPTFTGIILVLSYITALLKALDTKKNIYFLLLIPVILAIGLTYSRSSFLAFTFANFYIIFNKVRRKKLLLTGFSLLLIIGISLLPKDMGGEGVNLLRTNSIILKVENTYQGISVFSSTPLFGVGFNNICAVNMAKNNMDAYSHSCSGFDNSIVFLLASTGVTGVLSFAWLMYRLWVGTIETKNGLIWKSSIIAVLIHSMFTNTLFYPWIMGLVALLTSVSRKKTKV